MREVIDPTLEGMHQQGTPYTGFLYAGLNDRCRWNTEVAGVQLPHG